MRTCFPEPSADEINAMFPPPEPDRNTLGGLIKAERRDAKLTQRQLAGLVGVDFTYISKIENDRLQIAPSVDVLHRLADILALDETDLETLCQMTTEKILRNRIRELETESAYLRLQLRAARKRRSEQR